MSCTKSFLAAAAAALILGTAAAASAQTCSGDGDCPQGFACRASAVDVAEPACPPNVTCPAPPDASTTVVMSCQPKACTGDGDCGPGMVCHDEMSISCTGSGEAKPCAPDQPCDAAVKTMEMCTTTTTKTCTYRSLLPCNMDSDCGAGFTCAPTVSGACSGGGAVGGGSTPGSGGASGGAPPPPPVAIPDAAAPMCTTMTSYPGFCQAKVTSCTMDSDCPSPWKCLEAPSTGGGVVGSGGATGGPTRGGSDPGAMGAPTPAVPDGGVPPAMKVCAPPYGLPVRGGHDDKGGSNSTPEMGGQPTGNTGATSGDAGASTPPTTPGTTADAGATAAGSKSSGGCAIAANGSSGFGLLGLVGLGWLLRRRRRG